VKACGLARSCCASVACDLARNCCGRDGIHKKKGRLRCHKRPKSREETPKEGSDSAGGDYRITLAKTIAISGSIERRGHGTIRRFVALALKADHFRTRQTKAWHDGRAYCIAHGGFHVGLVVLATRCRPSLPAHYVEHRARHRCSMRRSETPAFSAAVYSQPPTFPTLRQYHPGAVEMTHGTNTHDLI